MNDRLLVDLGPEGRVLVGVQRGEELPDFAGAPFELSWPLDDDELEDLRWYLEDYLHYPYGADGARGERIAASLPRWGEAVFASIFGSGDARDAYIAARRRDAPPEIVFRSSAPGFLGLPWELMRDPAHPSPVALDLIGVSRSLPVAALEESFPVEGDVLRVLMVISRPSGKDDVGYRMVARPLLERLAAVRGRVELTVLRPPTLDALARALAAARDAGTPFQIVHFDGHGVLVGRGGSGAGGPLWFDGEGGQGVLVFERPEGGADHVPAASVAQALKEARVPVVVLNACQSGAVGKQLEAAVATRLLQEGVASVVAMAYSVYAVAAADFMAAFYERLFEGRSVTDAVGAGRRRLFARDRRPSPKGELALADWVVPVHYRRRDISFPALVTPRLAPRPLETMLDELRERSDDGAADEGALDPVGTFVGRDGPFYELEVACRVQRAVVLHGPGGTGKTELAKAFGRWWRDTDGADLVVFHSFEPGVASFGLDGVLAAIGLRAFGAQFARVEPEAREAIVLRTLREHRLLLIWDNFESVASMPDPTAATPPLDEAERERLRRFVAAVAAGGRSALLITSRTTEPWLGDAIARRAVGGLTRAEASEYADALLAGSGSAPARRARPVFGELLDALDGHPLSMRLVLPHVATTDPEALLDALRGHGELPSTSEHGRLASLERCVGYSFEHLDPATRRLLPAVSLFHGVVDFQVLGLMSGVEGVPERFDGVQWEQWVATLDAAAAVGLLTSIGGGMYGIHPALPAYLAALWRREAGDDHDREHARASSALLTAYAVFSKWLLGQMRTDDAGFALRIVDMQRRTMGDLLGTALEHERWEDALMIAEPLNEHLDSRGLYEEARGWVERVRLATESPAGASPDLQSAAGALWVFLVGSQANREQLQGRLERSEGMYLEIRDALTAREPSPTQQRHLGGAYHQLGSVAQDRGRLDDAEAWYRQSLTINEKLGNRPDMAATYHQLGTVAQDRGRLDDAEAWYRQSLTIKDELGNRPAMATTYHQLGTVAQDRGRLDDAEVWYRQSLTIEEELGNRPAMASTYHQLGTVAQLRGRLDDAEAWYRQSLTINVELGNRPAMAPTYFQLGTVAQDRGRLDDAEAWYRRSLTISEELGNRPGLAMIYGQLGLIAEERDDVRGALAWTVRCVALFDEFPHRATGPGPKDLARLTHVLGFEALEACWLDVTGSPLPAAVREHVRADVDREEGSQA